MAGKFERWWYYHGDEFKQGVVALLLYVLIAAITLVASTSVVFLTWDWWS